MLSDDQIKVRPAEIRGRQALAEIPSGLPDEGMSEHSYTGTILTDGSPGCNFDNRLIGWHEGGP